MPTNDTQTEQLPHWVIPSILFLIHGITVLLFTISSAPIAGPGIDAGAMAWLLWFFIDFPLGFVAIDVAESMPTNAITGVVVAIIGGIQWIIWGLLLSVMIRRFHRKSQ